jgi:hypothetical protein
MSRSGCWVGKKFKEHLQKDLPAEPKDLLFYSVFFVKNQFCKKLKIIEN